MRLRVQHLRLLVWVLHATKLWLTMEKSRLLALPCIEDHLLLLHIVLLLLIYVVHALLHNQFFLRSGPQNGQLTDLSESILYIFVIREILISQSAQIIKDSFDLLILFECVREQVFLRVFERLHLKFLHLILVLI